LARTWQFPSDASLLYVFRPSAILHVKLERSLFAIRGGGGGGVVPLSIA